MTLPQTFIAAIVACVPTFIAAQSSEYAFYNDLDWLPMSEESPAEVALLWGDLSEGPAAVLFRLPPGFASGTHAYESNYHAVVMQGIHTHWEKDQNPDTVVGLEKGDGWYQPAKAFHSDSNLTSDMVVIFAYFDGPVGSYTSD